MAAKMNVERIALHVPHMTPHAARELANGVERTVRAIQPAEGESAAALKARIAREIARALRKG